MDILNVLLFVYLCFSIMIIYVLLCYLNQTVKIAKSGSTPDAKFRSSEKPWELTHSQILLPRESPGEESQSPRTSLDLSLQRYAKAPSKALRCVGKNTGLGSENQCYYSLLIISGSCLNLLTSEPTVYSFIRRK